MSASDNWNYYKRNTSSLGCKDTPVHSLWNLLDNVGHEDSATSCPGRDSITTNGVLKSSKKPFLKISYLSSKRTLILFKF